MPITIDNSQFFINPKYVVNVSMFPQKESEYTVKVSMVNGDVFTKTGEEEEIKKLYNQILIKVILEEKKWNYTLK